MQVIVQRGPRRWPQAARSASTNADGSAPKKKRAPRHLEAAEQAAVVAWARARARSMPEAFPHLDRLFCSLAGMPMTPAQAKRAKGQGNRSGVFDLILPVPRNGFHGLFLEMKEPKGRPSAEQTDELEYLRSVGYDARICYGHREAIDAIRDYYKTTPQEEPPHGTESTTRRDI